MVFFTGKTNGGGEGIRTPGRSFLLQRFSRPPPSATRPPLRRGHKMCRFRTSAISCRYYTAYAVLVLAAIWLAVKSENT